MLGVVVATDTTALSAEYATLTEHCGLVDRSERGKLALSGSSAVEFLNGQVTNELVDLRPGEGCYAAFLTHKGKMLGDLRILVAGANIDGVRHVETPASASAVTDSVELLLDTERSALQALFDMIRRFKVGYDVKLHKRTLERSLLSLVGPDADAVVAKAFGLDSTAGGRAGAVAALDKPAAGGVVAHRKSAIVQGSSERKQTGSFEREDSHVLVCAGESPVRLIRTDVGLDALFESSAMDAVRSALTDAGAVETSKEAAEIVRVERGRPRYGIDLDENTIPQEAGLNERAVSFTKGCYVGQETVARLHYRGKPNRHLRGLRLSEPIEPGAELHLGERSIGHLRSSALSPTFGPIGLALVRREAEPGMTVDVGKHGAHAVVCELPFA
jgi:folate-binding protein YgfZ